MSHDSRAAYVTRARRQPLEASRAAAACAASISTLTPRIHLTLSRPSSLLSPSMGSRQQRVMVQPINVIFKYLQQKTRVSLWLYDNTDMRIEGCIIVSRTPGQREGGACGTSTQRHGCVAAAYPRCCRARAAGRCSTAVACADLASRPASSRGV